MDRTPNQIREIDQIMEILKNFVSIPDINQLKSFIEQNAESLLTDEAEEKLQNLKSFDFQTHLQLIRNCRQFGINKGFEEILK